MNIDLSSNTGFNDRQGLQNFLLVHRFVHLETANALTAKFKVTVSTFGLDSEIAEKAWLKLMADAEPGTPIPTALQDWLNVHADIHNQSYTLLGSTPTTAPDLSIADFSSAGQFYDWMYVHQQMHDFEYQQLGLT